MKFYYFNYGDIGNQLLWAAFTFIGYVIEIIHT